MKRRFTRALALWLAAMLILSVSSVSVMASGGSTADKMGTLPTGSGIPAIPTEARYQLADTALQLTKQPVYNTAPAATKHFRLIPELTAGSFDLRQYQYIYLWIYISETDLHDGDSIELCSGGKQDSKENAVRFNKWFNKPLIAGWNECLVPLSSFSFTAGGGWQLDAINFIGVVMRSKAAVQTGAVSRIYAVKESEVTDLNPDCPVEDAIPYSDARYQIQSTALQLTTKPVWATTAASGKHVRMIPTLRKTSFDLSDYDYIYTWMYLSATDLATGDSIELCSGGTNDKQENAVRLAEYTNGSLRVGWNELMIPIDAFKYTTGGSLDVRALNFIGVVLRSQSGTMTGMISEIYALTEADFTDTQPSGEEPPVGNGKLGRGKPVYDFNGQAAAEQDGVLYLSAGLPEIVQPAYYTYLCAEIYVENKVLLSRSNAALYISSSMEDGVQELSYALGKQSLYEGWNTVFLPIEDFRMSGYSYDDPAFGGLCDLLSINRVGVRWARRATAGTDVPVVKLGGLYLTSSNVTQPVPQGKYILTDRAMPITTGEVSCSVTTGASRQLARLMPEINYGSGSSVDISAKQYLYFWLYVSNAQADGSAGTDCELELCSGGKCDEEENAIRLYDITEDGEPWLMSGEYGSFADGWNEYAVPIEDLTRLTNKSGQAGKGCEAALLNYLRIYFRTKEGLDAEEVTYAIGPVYAVNPADLSAEGQQLPELHPERAYPGLADILAILPALEEPSFTDVSIGDWFYAEVMELAGRGLMNGVSAKTFGPSMPVSRAMLVTILHRAANCPAASGKNPFTDVPAGQWYTEAVLWAADNAVVNGYGNGRFAPNDTVSREQIAAILWRLAGSPAPSGSLRGFTDGSSVSSWAADAVLWCVNEGIFQGNAGALSMNRTATRAEIAAILSRYLKIC